MYRHLQKPL